MAQFHKVRLYRLLATVALSVATAACLKAKLSEQNAVRTGQGSNARYLATVPVQTESGQPGLCLYSAQGDGSAAAKIEPSNTGGAEVISRHALYQGELIQGLETIPGIDAFRQAAVNDLIGPTALIAGASMAAAGKFLPPGTRLPNPFANGVGSEASDEAQKLLAELNSKIASREAAAFEAAKDALRRTGFEFKDGAGRVTDAYNTSRDSARFQTWINAIETMVDRAPTNETKEGWKTALGEARKQDVNLSHFRQAVSKMQSELGSSSDRGLPNRIRSLTKDLERTMPSNFVQSLTGESGPLSKARGAVRAIRMSLPDGLKNVCSTAANSNRLVRAGLCLGGVAAGLFGVGWVGAGMMGAFSSADTDSLRSAIAADAASSPDVVIDGKSFETLMEGLRQFSDRLAADPTIQSMRPTCQ